LNQIKKILARTGTYLQEQVLTCKNRYLLARTGRFYGIQKHRAQNEKVLSKTKL